jgi:hypothetical protein
MAKSGLYLLNVTTPVSVPCLIAHAQERSPTWSEVSNSSGQEVGTVHIHLINLPRQEGRLQAMQDCADQNSRKNVASDARPPSAAAWANKRYKVPQARTRWLSGEKAALHGQRKIEMSRFLPN